MTLPSSYFDDLYRRDADPWKFETKPYEHEKYAATLAALPREHFQSGLEIGCSIGVLTRMLAAHCDHLLSVDASELPLQRARERNADLQHVRFERMRLPAEFPREHFDLIVMSEVGYYFDRADLERVQNLLLGALEADGILVLVHYLPRVPDYPLTGDEVHQSFLALAARGTLRHLCGFRAERYRLDVFAKP